MKECAVGAVRLHRPPYDRQNQHASDVRPSRMSEHRYTNHERREHLFELRDALERLLAAMRNTGQFLEYAPEFEQALSRSARIG